MNTSRLCHAATRLILPVCLVAILTLPQQTFAQQTQVSAEQYGVILNLAGRQRMLSQKMSKEFFLVAADYQPQANRDQLKQTMSLFEKTLTGLRDGDDSLGLPPTGSALIVKQLDKTKECYEQMQPVLAKVADGGTPSTEDIRLIAETNPPVLKNMNKAVKMYERRASKVLTGAGSLGVVINLAGKQRMLTQKLSKEFLLVYLGVDPENNRLNVRETAGLFDRTLKGLLDGDSDLELPTTTDPAIRDQLKTVADLWSGFYPTVQVAAEQDAAITPAQVATVAEKNLPLLKQMNETVKMYEKQAKNNAVAAVE